MKSASLPRCSTVARGPSSQHGMSLLQVMLILVLLGAIIAAGFQIVQSRGGPEAALSQEKALSWADQSIVAFAAANSRLPCPAARIDGPEDCSLSGTGYLPRQTLEKYTDAISSNMLGASGVGRLPGPLLYAAYKTADIDLSAAAQYYTPTSYDPDEDSYENRADFTSINGLDFCAALSGAALSNYDGNALHLNADASNSSANIAYGIAVAGQTPGANGRFDGDNKLNALSIGRPNAPSGSDYDDRVRVRSFASLAQTVGCTQLSTVASYRGEGPLADNIPIISMDLLNEAVAIDEATKDTQQNTKDNADQSLSVAKRTVALSAIEVALASADVTASALDAAEAGVIQGTSIALCIVSLGIECWRVFFSTAGLSAQVAALGFSVSAVPPAIVAAGLNGASLSYAQTAARMAGMAIGTDPANLEEALKQAQDAAYGVDCTTNKGVEKCEQNGLKQISAELLSTAVASEAKRDSFNNTVMVHWADAYLPYRIPGYNNMSVSGRNNAVALLQGRLSTARSLMDKQIALEAMQGDQKAYQDRLDSYDEINNPQGDFNKEKTKTCKKTDDTSKILCKNYEDMISFINTCVRADGGLDAYNPTAPASRGPYCIPALNTAIAQNKIKITTQTGVVTSALTSARTRRVAGPLTELTLAADGSVSNPSPYPYIYPPSWYHSLGFMTDTQWNFCKPIASEKSINKCTNLNSKSNYEAIVTSSGVPLYRSSANWVSYADAYRLQTQLTADATEARKAATSTADAYQEMLQQIENIKAAINGKSTGTGTPAEIWLGAGAALGIADERGALGPDRKSAGNNVTDTQTRSTATP